ncbi:MAG: hypothetical protein U0V48_18510 [Anaerolineales bacterium]
MGAIKLVSIAVSAIPAGIAGWQIGSHNPSARMKRSFFSSAIFSSFRIRSIAGICGNLK